MDGTFVKKPKLKDSYDDPSVCVLRVKRLSNLARLPTRGSSHAAGYDLYRCVGCVYYVRFE